MRTARRKFIPSPIAGAAHIQAKDECEKLMKIFDDYELFGGGFTETQSKEMRLCRAMLKFRSYNSALGILRSLQKQIMTHPK